MRITAAIAILLTCSAQAATPVAKPVPTPQASAFIDLAGYWVSIVSEDFKYRMLTAPKGDAGSLPVNEAARKVAANWDPVADKAAGESCRVFGAAGNIRQPGRLHISWQDERTLRIDFSAGVQTRLLSFEAPAAAPRSWAGQSFAQWSRVRNWAEFAPPTVAPVGGTLKVITTNMRSGYLQSNGFPYSENARMTEYFDRISYGDQPWLIVTTVVEDPQFLREPLIWSTHFRHEADASKWKPQPCDAS